LNWKVDGGGSVASSFHRFTPGDKTHCNFDQMIGWDPETILGKYKTKQNKQYNTVMIKHNANLKYEIVYKITGNKISPQ